MLIKWPELILSGLVIHDARKKHHYFINLRDQQLVSSLIENDLKNVWNQSVRDAVSFCICFEYKDFK